MQELSQWFNLSEQMPWQVGIYKTEDSDGDEYFNYWDGKSFHWGVRKNDEVPMDDPMDSPFTWTVKWRGLSSDPSKPAPSPKPRGNRRVTRYVVSERAYTDASYRRIVGVYANLKNAQIHSERVPYGHVETIRFRTPEASQSKEN